jgi:hypothetical protein
MRDHNLIKQILLVLVMLAVVVFSGCDSKTEKTDMTKDDGTAEDVKSDTSLTGDVPPREIGQPTETTVQIMDVTGTWTGVFDKRPTVLNITSQTDSSFSGKISISYRQAINQDVKGSFSPAAMMMLMTDQLHSRFQGKYKGKLSEDGRNFSGIFTMDLDGKQFSFNLNK